MLLHENIGAAQQCFLSIRKQDDEVIPEGLPFQDRPDCLQSGRHTRTAIAGPRGHRPAVIVGAEKNRASAVCTRDTYHDILNVPSLHKRRVVLDSDHGYILDFRTKTQRLQFGDDVVASFPSRCRTLGPWFACDRLNMPHCTLRRELTKRRILRNGVGLIELAQCNQRGEHHRYEQNQRTSSYVQLRVANPRGLETVAKSHEPSVRLSKESIHSHTNLLNHIEHKQYFSAKTLTPMLRPRQPTRRTPLRAAHDRRGLARLFQVSVATPRPAAYSLTMRWALNRGPIDFIAYLTLRIQSTGTAPDPCRL